MRDHLLIAGGVAYGGIGVFFGSASTAELYTPGVLVAPPELLSGRNLLLFNLEYRARPFELRTVYLGLVLFYDAGSAFDDLRI